VQKTAPVPVTNRQTKKNTLAHILYYLTIDKHVAVAITVPVLPVAALTKHNKKDTGETGDDSPIPTLLKASYLDDVEAW
jgi:hypothetical protein